MDGARRRHRRGFCGPGLTSCSSGCANLQTEQTNCGACGYDCGGSACTAGACGRVQITSVDLAYGVAAASNSVYWIGKSPTMATYYAVQSCPTSGCTAPPRMIADGLTSPGTNFPLYGGTMVADGSFVRWLGPGTSTMFGSGVYVLGCPATSCNGNNPKVAGANDSVRQIALVGSTVYATVNTGNAKMCPMDACNDPLTGILGAGCDNAWGVTADATNIYYSSSVTGGVEIIKCPTSGCSGLGVNLIADGKFVVEMGGTLYASTNGNTVVSCSTTGCGGSPTQLAQNQPGITALVADATHIYFALGGSLGASDGEIRVCDLPDCNHMTPRSLMSSQAHPTSMYLDSGFLYWANGGTGTAGSGGIIGCASGREQLGGDARDITRRTRGTRVRASRANSLASDHIRSPPIGRALRGSLRLRRQRPCPNPCIARSWIGSAFPSWGSVDVTYERHIELHDFPAPT